MFRIYVQIDLTNFSVNFYTRWFENLHHSFVNNVYNLKYYKWKFIFHVHYEKYEIFAQKMQFSFQIRSFWKFVSIHFEHDLLHNFVHVNFVVSNFWNFFHCFWDSNHETNKKKNSCFEFHEKKKIKLNISFFFIACFYSQISQIFKNWILFFNNVKINSNICS